MDEIKRNWDVLSKEKRKSCIEEIIQFFKDERNEKIGVIAGGNILDLFLQTAGKEIYNKGVDDSKNLLKRLFEDLEIDLDILLKTGVLHKSILAHRFAAVNFPTPSRPAKMKDWAVLPAAVYRCRNSRALS